ncbi:amino acid adenylation domain-containing protein [Paenibacillus sp. LMG 31460]|uniref:Amino acid adenylation domain-containing protein n=1 Tax=Paenibacillus germinis TaxID=2654979 RepID=A0ABX1Z8M9_9BACL|nr:non-ribosomal peptide synthetase [Paenibacillus germinis]NOU89219.1 amino acid adenylation domain-containing protein [Paenibacillus germinis]
MKKSDTIQKVYPLTPMQEGMLFHSIMDPDSSAYHNLLQAKLCGQLDVSLFEQSFNQLIAENDILRTAFVHQNLQRPRQVVLSKRTIQLHFEQIDHLDESEQRNCIASFISERNAGRYNLAKDVPMYIAVFQTAEQEYQFIWSHHHILMDGWGLGIVINRLFQIYEALKNEKTLPQEAVYPFSDYIKWLEKQDKDESLAYWQTYLDGYEQSVHIPKAFVPEDSLYQKQEISFVIDETTTGRIAQLASSCQTTVNTVFQTIWGLLLSKYNHTNDVVFGSVVSGRPSQVKGIEKMVGLFINTIPVRISYQDEQSFGSLLAEAQRNALASEANHFVPLYEIQSQNGHKQDLFDHILIFENYPVAKELQNNGWEGALGFVINDVHVEEQTNYPLNIVVAPGAELLIKLSFNAAVYAVEWMNSIEGHMKQIIAQVVADPHMLPKHIQIVTEQEKQQILYSFNDTEIRYPQDQEQTLHALFEQQAIKTPDQTAIVCGDLSMTYRELNERANKLAWVLKEKGVGKDRMVAIMTERSLEMSVGLLAILKAGGAYVPCDPEYPANRIRYLLEDSGSQFLLSKTGLMHKVEGSHCEFLDLQDEANYASDAANLTGTSGLADLAYMIYTSGTTGQPKGVMIEHASIVNTIRWRKEEYGFGTDDRVLLFLSFSFDAFVSSFFAPLVSGSTVVMVSDEEAKDPLALKKRITSLHITHFSCVPSLYAAILETMHAEEASSLKAVTLGGESISPYMLERTKRIIPGAEIVNEYGPTENSVISTVCRNLVPGESVTIGHPIANSQVYILDQHHQLLPVGVKGELCVAGAGLARGYWNREALTLGKFIDNPFLPGTKMYKTGDLAKWLPNGNIEFIDRIDHQVKIRGYRIELGEIDAAILRHRLVKEAVVLVVEDGGGEKALAVYYTLETGAAAELKDDLLQVLPAYMVPSYFIPMERLPLTPNGKIDRKALPKLEGKLKSAAVNEAPANLTEANLLPLWQEILKTEYIGVTDNFFENGGHSLKAMMLISKIHQELKVEVPIKVLFDSPTIRQIAKYIQGADEQVYAAIRSMEQRDYYPVSSAQKRMFVLNRLDPDGTSSNMPGAMLLEGPLDVEKFRGAFQALVARHDTLRTSFDTVDGEPVQIVHPQVELRIPVKEANEEDAAEMLNDFIHPFNLSKAPLLRVELIRFAAERHLFLFDLHHIISDGTSMGLIVKEFMLLYQGNYLPELAIQYKDFSIWQHEWFGSEVMKRQETFWVEMFGGDVPVLEIPTDYPRPPIQSFEGDKVIVHTGKELKEALRRLASESGTTLFMVMLAAYNVLLAKYTGQEDIVVGTPIAGRSHPDLQSIIGMFVGTLALRNRVDGKLPFAEFLAQVKMNMLHVYDNQDYPFETLVEQVDVRRDMSRNPLFDTMFVLQNIELEAMVLDGLSISPGLLDNPIAKFDLTIEAREDEEGIELCFVYRTKLFKQETVKCMADHFLNILHTAVANPYQTISHMDMLSEAEKRHLLVDLNDTAAQYPEGMTLHELFEVQAAKWPDRIAVVCGGDRLTYRELNERANQLGQEMRSLSVLPDDRVGLLVDRSLDMIVGILATLKAGGVYVPLDPDYPQDRLQFMLDDSGARVLLTLPQLTGKVPFNGTVLDMSDPALYSGDGSNLESVNQPEDMAYIIYTSGTTGQPKGVMIEHRNVVRLMLNDRMKFDFTERDVWTVFHSFCFDFSVWEMYGALLYGGTCVVVPKSVAQNPKEFAQLLRQEGVTVLNQTPTAFYALIHEVLGRQDNDLQVRYVIFGGEALNPIMLKPWKAKYPQTQLINMYGITETTVHVTFKEITEQDMEISLSNIGRPIPTLTSYIFDSEQRLVPIGVTGELYVGGEGVARGYLNRDELTAERFIANPYKPEERLYRSGDLARLLRSGEMEYLGRIDHQVKIRGHRIELGEIETQLLRHEAIREAVVMALDDEQGQKFLCAYLLLDQDLTVTELRAHASEDLPAYMIPSHFVRLPHMPMTSNGKVDRKALPKPEGGLKTGAEYIAPRNELEEKLVHIWQEVLGSDRIGIRDNFFDLGGDSIKGIQVASRLFNHGLQLEMKDLFRYPSIEELSSLVALVKRQISQETVTGEVGLTPIQQWFFDQCFANQHHWNQSVMLHKSDGFDSLALEKALRDLVQHHDALRMVYDEQDGRIVQLGRGLEGEMYGFERFDFTDHSDTEVRIASAANHIQQSFDLSQGPLLKAALFQTAEGDHLLLAAHHLIVDGISWRILFEDLATSYAQALAGEDTAFQEKTDSFQYWSQRLMAYAESKELLQEIDYWKQLENKSIGSLYKDFAIETCTLGESATAEITLTREQTEHLLKHVHQAYHTEMNDILLTAVGLAVQEWGQTDRIAVQLEGHGREEMMEDVNISRTVGWFTSMYPVVLDLTDGDLSREIKSVKETLRQVPNKGIGYDILKYLTPEDKRSGLHFKLKPEICFNYLGQFDANLVHDAFGPSPYDMGEPINPNSHRMYPIIMNGMIANGEMSFRFSYSPKQYEESTMQCLSAAFKYHLLRIIDHCRNKEESERTASDFSSKGLTTDDVDDIFELLGEKL